jgi:ATP-dependent Clp protease ATP-binding subunit ClpA
MEENLDQALAVDVLAAALRMDHQESGDLLEFLAKKLEQSLPQNTTVTRGGWFLSKNHPVQEIMVRFEDYHYQIVREQHAVTAKVLKLVRGVVLKTTVIPVEQWTDEVAQQLAELAGRNGQTRIALNKFVLGGG